MLSIIYIMALKLTISGGMGRKKGFVLENVAGKR